MKEMKLSNQLTLWRKKWLRLNQSWKRVRRWKNNTLLKNVNTIDCWKRTRNSRKKTNVCWISWLKKLFPTKKMIELNMSTKVIENQTYIFNNVYVYSSKKQKNLCSNECRAGICSFSSSATFACKSKEVCKQILAFSFVQWLSNVLNKIASFSFCSIDIDTLSKKLISKWKFCEW